MKRILCAVMSLMLTLVLIAAMIPLAAAQEKETFYATSKLVALKSNIEKDAGMNSYATAQGACSDGKYAYFAVQSGATVILKYDLTTWRLKKKSDRLLSLGHANDLTYNGKENTIVVANNAPDYDRLTLVDPDTLKVTGTVKLSIKVYSIAYNETLDRYVAGISGGYDFAVLDSSFKVLKKYKGVNTGYLRQGCDCDDDYIYFPQSNNQNLVVIYDYSGKHVATVSLGHSYEAENLFHAGSSFYTTLHYYGNFVYRVGLSDQKAIRYTVRYDPGGADGEMKNTSVVYGTDTKLRANAFEKAGYHFGGWTAYRSFDGKYLGYRLGAEKEEWLTEEELYRYRYYPDEGNVSKTTKSGSVTLSAFWIRDYYDVAFDSDGGEGYMEPYTIGYHTPFTVPENEFTKQGYIFDGYTASRSVDGRVYGYLKDSDKPEWLEAKDAYREHVFKQGDTFSELTYDGALTLTAQFTFAFVFDDDLTTLLRYNGVDEDVVIPNAAGKLDAITTDAFNGSSLMRTLSIPSTVDKIEKGALTDCDALTTITFNERFPSEFDIDCVMGTSRPLIYLVKDGRLYFLGFYADRCNATLIRNHAASLMRTLDADS